MCNWYKGKAFLKWLDLGLEALRSFWLFCSCFCHGDRSSSGTVKLSLSPSSNNLQDSGFLWFPWICGHNLGNSASHPLSFKLMHTQKNKPIYSQTSKLEGKRIPKLSIITIITLLWEFLKDLFFFGMSDCARKKMISRPSLRHFSKVSKCLVLPTLCQKHYWLKAMSVLAKRMCLLLFILIWKLKDETGVSNYFLHCISKESILPT